MSRVYVGNLDPRATGLLRLSLHPPPAAARPHLRNSPSPPALLLLACSCPPCASPSLLTASRPTPWKKSPHAPKLAPPACVPAHHASSRAGLCTEREMEDEFRVYGVLRSVWVARKPPGFAFIEFEDRRDAEDAIKGSNGKNGWRVEMSRGPGGPGGGRGAGRARYRRSPSYGRASPVRRPRSPGYDEDRNGHSSRRHRSPSPVYRSRYRSPDRRSPRQSRSRSYDRWFHPPAKLSWPSMFDLGKLKMPLPSPSSGLLAKASKQVASSSPPQREPVATTSSRPISSSQWDPSSKASQSHTQPQPQSELKLDNKSLTVRRSLWTFA
eukprot:SM000314S12179  [mRNA]  locus=s314:62877:65342:+ [translate_table: standard]